MEQFDRKKHWENIYRTRALHEASWYQPKPEISLRFLEEFHVPATARIIDIGGGDSLLVDHLLELGYQNVTVLDISERALARARERLGDCAKRVTWIAADVAAFAPAETYDFWHDRATFHFLSQEEEIANYLHAAYESLSPEGVLVVGTFSDKGPDTCSGLKIRRYSEIALAERFDACFDKVTCIPVDHITPSGACQHFIFGAFRKKQ